MSETVESSPEISRADIQLIMQVYLSEYDKCTTEINLLIGEVHQLSLSALASVAGLASLVVVLINISPELLAAVLLFLPLPFAAMMFSYLGHVNSLINIGEYLSEQLEPNIKQLIKSSVITDSSVEILGWSRFHRTKVESKIGWMSQGLWSIGQGLLIGFPIIGSLVAFFFTIDYAGISITGWWIPILVVDLGLVVLILLLSGLGLNRYGFKIRVDKSL